MMNAIELCNISTVWLLRTLWKLDQEIVAVWGSDYSFADMIGNLAEDDLQPYEYPHMRVEELWFETTTSELVLPLRMCRAKTLQAVERIASGLPVYSFYASPSLDIVLLKKHYQDYYWDVNYPESIWYLDQVENLASMSEWIIWDVLSQKGTGWPLLIVKDNEMLETIYKLIEAEINSCRNPKMIAHDESSPFSIRIVDGTQVVRDGFNTILADYKKPLL